MASCVLCRDPATHILVYLLQVNRVEVPLCKTHLDSVTDDMPELISEGKVNVYITIIAPESLIPNLGGLTKQTP